MAAPCNGCQGEVCRDYCNVVVTEVDVSIIEPADSTLPVRHGSSFSLKCVARLREDGTRTRSVGLGRRSSASRRVSTGLRWLHDGQPLADGRTDGLCGRVHITDVVDIDTGHSRSLCHLG